MNPTPPVVERVLEWFSWGLVHRFCNEQCTNCRKRYNHHSNTRSLLLPKYYPNDIHPIVGKPDSSDPHNSHYDHYHRETQRESQCEFLSGIDADPPQKYDRERENDNVGENVRCSCDSGIANHPVTGFGPRTGYKRHLLVLIVYQRWPPTEYLLCGNIWTCYYDCYRRCNPGE